MNYSIIIYIIGMILEIEAVFMDSYMKDLTLHDTVTTSIHNFQQNIMEKNTEI